MIGASTGGPSALHEVLSGLPVELGAPVLIVQHMPPTFTRIFADRLRQSTGFDVSEAAGDEPLQPGRVLVAPGGRHLTVSGREATARAIVGDGPPENACRPSIDALFRAAAASFGDRVLAVVLTGMGVDGLRGCEAVRRAGGQVVVQDEATSVIASMPGAVAQAGLADAILPLTALGPELARRIGWRRRAAGGGAR